MSHTNAAISDYCTATAVVFAYCGGVQRKYVVMIFVPRLPWLLLPAEACRGSAVITSKRAMIHRISVLCRRQPCLLYMCDVKDLSAGSISHHDFDKTDTSYPFDIISCLLVQVFLTWYSSVAACFNSRTFNDRRSAGVRGSIVLLSYCDIYIMRAACSSC